MPHEHRMRQSWPLICPTRLIIFTVHSSRFTVHGRVVSGLTDLISAETSLARLFTLS